MSAASRLPGIGWLFPSPDEPGVAIARRTQLVLTVSLVLANIIGASVVATFLLLVLPTPQFEDQDLNRVLNLGIAAAFVGLGTIVGTIWGSKRLWPMREWIVAERPPTEEERIAVLRAPYRIVGVHAILWSSAAVVLGIVNVQFSSEMAARVSTTVLLGGLTTCAIAYLFTERGLRAAAARALAEGVGDTQIVPGIRARALLAWMLGTGIPLIGVVLVGISTLAEQDFNADELALTVLVLAGIALAVGLYVSTLAARAVADPVREVQVALERVERGELDVEVPVYDGSEVGRLQAGFNRMVAGLRERDRIQDLFGRHVGEEVARAALEQEVELGGETLEVSALFVDVVGSTKIASERQPHEVVEFLNSFFAEVVAVVGEEGGWVNKFEGDAALAIFGAPVPVSDHATQALGAARALQRRLEPGMAGIGVSCGEVVAGNIGDEARFEYTVIGDPVNEAARLTELAKNHGGVLASEAIVRCASDEEAARWELGESVELRGRSAATRLAKPRG